MNPYPKPKALRDRRYLTWLRKQPCFLSGVAATDLYPNDPHHVKFLGGGGTSLKPPDDHAIPISQLLHMRLDSWGWSEWTLFESFYPDKSRDEIREIVREAAGEYFLRFKERKAA